MTTPDIDDFMIFHPMVLNLSHLDLDLFADTFPASVSQTLSLNISWVFVVGSLD